MTVNRRGFLGSLMALAAVPFVRTPKPQTWKLRGWRFQWPDGAVTEATDLNETFRVGETITVRVPQRWKAKDSLQPHLHNAMLEKLCADVRPSIQSAMGLR